MKMRDRLHADQTSIVKRIKAGESTCSIAKDYDCNPGTIWYFLQSIGVEPVRKRSTNYGHLDSRKSEIIELLDLGWGGYKIAKKLGISKSSILKKIKEWGYDLSYRRKDDPNNRLKDKWDEVRLLFESGYSCVYIAKKLGHSQPSVMYLLNQHGYDTSDWKYNVESDFFAKVDTEYKAYILGWIYSDGNVMKSGTVRISIAQDDEEILVWMKKTMGYEGPLYYKQKEGNRKPQVELCINRKELVNDLANLGVMPAKSLILKCPNSKQVPKHLFHHFIRGVFDGDGSISRTVMICGSYFFTYELAKLLPCEITNIYQRYKDREPEKSAHQLFIGRQSEIKKFAQWLYKDSTISLSRKYAKMKKWL